MVSSTPRLAPRGTKPAGFCVATPAGARIQHDAQLVGIVGLDDPHEAGAEAERRNNACPTSRPRGEAPAMSCFGFARVSMATPLPP